MELVAQADSRRAQDEHDSRHDDRHDNVGYARADSPVHAFAVKEVDDATQAERDNQRPDQDGDRNGKDFEQVDDNARHQNDADRAPDYQAAFFQPRVRILFASRTRALRIHFRQLHAPSLAPCRTR